MVWDTGVNMSLKIHLPAAMAALVAAAWLCAAPVLAQVTPVGVWHTIDDRSNEPKGEVIITEVNGVVTGRVGRALKDEEKQRGLRLVPLGRDAVVFVDDFVALNVKGPVAVFCNCRESFVGFVRQYFATFS
jgi:hypothetical protein